MSNFLYGLIKHFSKVNVRFTSLSMFEKEIFKLINEIENSANLDDSTFSDDQRKMLKAFLVRYCSLVYKNKPKINNDMYTRYRNYLKVEEKYFTQKTTKDQFINNEAFEIELNKWQNLKPEMNPKTRNQYKKYRTGISEWMENLDVSQLGEEAIKAISKKRRNSFLTLKDIVLRFKDLNDRICDLTKYLDNYSS